MDYLWVYWDGTTWAVDWRTGRAPLNLGRETPAADLAAAARRIAGKGTVRIVREVEDVA